MTEPRRSWWQAPRRVADRITDRRVSFLELFYDLVFVVIIAETAHRLSTHLDWHGLAVFAGMFTVAWWAWLNGTMYHDLHGNDDLRTRFFTFLQMIAVAAMAVFAHEAVGDYSRHFAVAYAALQLILAFLWLSTGISDPDHRPLSIPYTINMLISVGLFVLSVFVSEEIRYTLWFIAMIVALLGSQLPLFLARVLRPKVGAQLERSRSASESAIERFGLFTIIVLGEVIVGVVRGLIDHHQLDWMVGATAALGMLIAIGLWWNYFDFVSLQKVKPGLYRSSVWMWLHLPMTMGIAATGAAILHAVEAAPSTPDSVPVLILVGSIAVTILSVAWIGLQVEGGELRDKSRRTARWFLLAASSVAVILGFVALSAIALLLALAVILLVPVAAGFVVWVRNQPIVTGES